MISKGKDSLEMSSGRGALRLAPWVTTVFLLLILGFASAVSFLLIREGRGWVLVLATAFGALLLILARLETEYFQHSLPQWTPLTGRLASLGVVSFAVFAVCYPTLNSYFSGDEFAYIHLFYRPSFSLFLRLFHGDLSQGVWGYNAQELRPFYGLSYMLSYSLWGLHPLGYHLSGALVHVLNAWMVLLIARRMEPGQSGRAGFAALLFATLATNSWNVSWANGYLTEGIPTLFYLSAFVGFVSYRRTGLARYLALAVAAFAACLLSKETAVTLPAMLISYDLFCWLVGERRNPACGGPSSRQRWLAMVPTHAPFVLLILGYFELRHLALASYLREQTWGSHLHEAVTTPSGFWLHFTHAAVRLWDLQAFNLQHLLLPYPAVASAIVLGALGAWTAAILRHMSACRLSVALIVYFGLVWYVVSNAPLTVIYLDPHHLYIPSAGLCVAAAFLAIPAGTEHCPRIGYVGWLGGALVVLIFACQLRSDNAQWARKAEVSGRGTAQLAQALMAMPKQSLVIVWFPPDTPPMSMWDENLPYALQPPFQTADLYSPSRIIELPGTFCCPLPQWWEKTRGVLTAGLAGTQEGTIDIELFAWDERSTAFEVRQRAAPKRLLRACVTKSLGGPLETAEMVEEPKANMLVNGLARLVLDGT
jgi:hypothetical protein